MWLPSAGPARHQLFVAFLLLFALLLTAGCGGGTTTAGNNPPPGGGGGSIPPPGGGGDGGNPGPSLTTETVVSGLTVPWEIAWSPDGRMFFTEQPGRLRVFADGALQSAPVFDATAISHGGEAGMLGLAIDPAFSSNHFLYVFYCLDSGASPSGIKCRVSRITENGGQFADETVLLEFNGGVHHDAGRIKIGPDRLLYVAVGDFGTPETAQDDSSFGGKILRMNLDGSPASFLFENNPYIYSMGHRDPQGLMFDSSGQLYSTEHGENSNDEVNIIFGGKNYGWPTCQGMCNNAAFVDPIKLFNPETAAPSGGTFYNSSTISQWQGSMLFGTLGLADNTFAHHIHRIKLNALGGTQITEEEALFKDKFGRIRDVVQGPDGFVYFATSNGDGNDKIVRIKPQ
jgi:glucose/arabinose dehydrogenase